MLAAITANSAFHGTRLDVEHIDLYQLHGGTIDDPTDETIEAFEELKQGFRAGIPERRGFTAMADAEKLFSILRSLGGSRLVGNAGQLAAGTFWPEVWY